MVFTVDELLTEADKAKTRDQRATLVAIGYAECKELGPIVQRVEGSDSDPKVRKFARVTLGGLQKAWKEQSAQLNPGS